MRCKKSNQDKDKGPEWLQPLPESKLRSHHYNQGQNNKSIIAAAAHLEAMAIGQACWLPVHEQPTSELPASKSDNILILIFYKLSNGEEEYNGASVSEMALRQVVAIYSSTATNNSMQATSGALLKNSFLPVTGVLGHGQNESDYALSPGAPKFKTLSRERNAIPPYEQPLFDPPRRRSNPSNHSQINAHISNFAAARPAHQPSNPQLPLPLPFELKGRPDALQRCPKGLEHAPSSVATRSITMYNADIPVRKATTSALSACASHSSCYSCGTSTA
eukprot:6210663-Pleurochrysis_carterae.AAC.3